MANYKKQTMLGGSWVKASEVTAKKAKIVSETNPQTSTFLNKDGSPKTQDVAKVQFQADPEPLNVNLNRATINGLVDAFGEDSKDWQGHVLTVETEKMRVAGKAVTALYLIPENYERVDDENGYAVIVKKGTAKDEIPSVNLDDVPF
jgi:hypothetical protein